MSQKVLQWLREDVTKGAEMSRTLVDGKDSFPKKIWEIPLLSIYPTEMPAFPPKRAKARNPPKFHSTFEKYN